MQHTKPQSSQSPKPLSKHLIIVMAAAFFITGLMLAGLLHYWNGIRPIDKSVPIAVEEVPTSKELICEDGWKAYKREAIKVGFCYPEAWGDAMLVDAKFTPKDTGTRWLINFESKPEVSVGVVSADWSTEAGRSGACPHPTKAAPDYAAFSNEWKAEGGTTSASSAYRGVDVRPDYYLIDETASEYLDGACLRGVAEIKHKEYPLVTASYYRQFGGGIINAGQHMGNPVILAPVDDRSDFINLVRSISAL